MTDSSSETRGRTVECDPSLSIKATGVLSQNPIELRTHEETWTGISGDIFKALLGDRGKKKVVVLNGTEMLSLVF